MMQRIRGQEVTIRVLTQDTCQMFTQPRAGKIPNLAGEIIQEVTMRREGRMKRIVVSNEMVTRRCVSVGRSG